MRRATLLVSFTLLSLLAVAPVAEAHLMPRGKGTLNVVGSKAYIVLSVPVASFYGPDASPHVNPEDLQRDQDKLREHVRRGLRVRSGDQLATHDQVLFNLPSGDGHDPKHQATHGDDLVLMLVVRFDQPPLWIELTSDLWAGDDEALVIQATVSEGAQTVRSEVGTLTASRPAYRFFRDP